MRSLLDMSIDEFFALTDMNQSFRQHVYRSMLIGTKAILSDDVFPLKDGGFVVIVEIPEDQDDVVLYSLDDEIEPDAPEENLQCAHTTQEQIILRIPSS